MVHLRKRAPAELNDQTADSNGHSNNNGAAAINGNHDESQESIASLKDANANVPPPMYKAIRFFFQICLHSFYGNVEVEGTENIAPDNYPAILGIFSCTLFRLPSEHRTICGIIDEIICKRTKKKYIVSAKIPATRALTLLVLDFICFLMYSGKP
jgi:hypothetical protein